MQLTGISQCTVEQAEPIEVVLKDFYAFLEQHLLFHRPTSNARSFVFCTDGPMDLMGFLRPECRRKGATRRVTEEGKELIEKAV